jgi:hypothetical protein
MKNARKIIGNWLVRFLGSASGSTVAREGIMPIDYGLKESCGGIS